MTTQPFLLGQAIRGGQVTVARVREWGKSGRAGCAGLSLLSSRSVCAAFVLLLSTLIPCVFLADALALTTGDYFLHATGGNRTLVTTAPTGPLQSIRVEVSRTAGNPWRPIGTWTATAAGAPSSSPR